MSPSQLLEQTWAGLVCMGPGCLAYDKRLMQSSVQHPQGGSGLGEVRPPLPLLMSAQRKPKEKYQRPAHHLVRLEIK